MLKQKGNGLSQRKRRNINGKMKMTMEKNKKRKGPRLPSTLHKEINAMQGSHDASSDEGAGSGAEERVDVYEYEEGTPEEETKKNQRFDPVENLEYELPEDFKDEDLSSDEEAQSDGYISVDSEKGEGDHDRHLKMLQRITGMPGQAFQDKKKKEPLFYDVHGMDNGGTQINIQDLLDPLHGMPGYSNLRKKLSHLEKKSGAIQAPLPKVQRERLERKVAYEHSKKEMTKWEPLVKRNREAPTIFFNEDVDIGYSTVGAIMSEFKPRTEFEKKMASLVRNPDILDAHENDGSRLLELNKISVEDVKERKDRLAKMRSLLFRHEMKAKRIKRIKSKAYHRMLKKDRLKTASAQNLLDPESIKEQTMRQEFKRAEERMTLKHKNSSKWAKRIMKRGLNAQDDGTRAAISEQLHQHELLTRKMNSMRDTSSSECSSDNEDSDDEVLGDASCGGVSKILSKAKEKTLKIMEDEDDMPKSGLLSLPFMVRGLERKKEALRKEGRVAIEGYDTSLKKLDCCNKTFTSEGLSCGRKTFSASFKEPQGKNDKVESDNTGISSDSEADFDIKRSSMTGHEESNSVHELQSGTEHLLPKQNVEVHKSTIENIDDIQTETGPKTTYEVSIFVNDSFKKIEGKSIKRDNTGMNPVTAPDSSQLHLVSGNGSDMDSDDEMVDGFLSSGAKSEYELPCRSDLYYQAFDGDDVEVEFERQKMDLLKEEVPEPEKPVLLPGWGEWTHIQKKKGLPKWMLSEHQDATRKREEALKSRKDAHLKNVIISEKIDKKTDKLHTKALPFPFTSKEVFEQSIRMPIGPEYNPAVALSALNRPAVVKKPGILIKPIQFEEVDPCEKSTEPKQSRRSNRKNKEGKTQNKVAFGGKKMKA